MKASDLVKGYQKKEEIETPPPEEREKEMPPPKKKVPAFRLSEIEIFDLSFGKDEKPEPEEGEITPEEPEKVEEREMTKNMPFQSRFEPGDTTEVEGEKPAEPELEKKQVRLVEPEPEDGQVNGVEPESDLVEVQTVEPEILKDKRVNAETLYRLSKVYLSDLRERVRKSIPVDIRPVIDAMDWLIRENLVSDEVIQGISRLSIAEEYYISHAINTAAYAVRLGRSFGYAKKELLELAIGAYLCDIGLFKIPEAIINKPTKLSPEEVELVKSHPEIGRELISSYASDYPNVIKVVYEHHEREDGSGYPLGIGGDNISEFAKIVGICDSYVAMTHNRPHKKALIQIDTMRELISMKGRFFSAKIIKAFLDEVSIFPIGSYVVLNNKMIGLVIATNRYNPFKPKVKLLFDEYGRRFEEPRLVDLMTNPVLNIESNILPDDLPKAH